jgi:hypothetical protein
MRTEDKIVKVVRALRFEISALDNSYDESKTPIAERVYKINRQKLRCIIAGELMTSTRKTIYAYFDVLLGSGLISPNPTSQMSCIQNKIMPTNDTRYFLNKEEIIESWNNTLLKNKSTTPTLSTFIQT